MMRKMKTRKTTPPVLKGSVVRGASAAGVLGSRSRFPPLPCPQLHGLWDHWSVPEEAALNSLGRVENNVLAPRLHKVQIQHMTGFIHIQR